jgi:hypothetical protein
MLTQSWSEAIASAHMLYPASVGNVPRSQFGPQQYA